MQTETQRQDDRLRLELEKSLPRLDFDPVLHERYRDALREHRKFARVLYYLAPAFLFGLLGWSDASAWQVPEGFAALLRYLEAWLFLPVFGLAVCANISRLPRGLSTRMHVLATVTLWSGVLCLQYAAHGLGAYFPPEILSATMLGAALLCGFRLQPILLGIVTFSLLDLLCEWLARSAPSHWLLDVPAVAVLGLSAAGGAYLVEGSRRRLWIAGEIADRAARNDPLTGLATRAEFNRRFPLLIAAGRRERRPVSLLLFAIDGFRAINERYDHLYGDLVLQVVASKLMEPRGHADDVRARFGGGKLALVCYGADAQEAAESARLLLQAVRSAEPERPAFGTAPRISCSIGVVTAVPDDDATPAELLRSAEDLMNQASRAGGDRMLARGPRDAQAPQQQVQAAR